MAGIVGSGLPPSQVFLPRLGRSPAPGPLMVASAATKGEPPGEGPPSTAHPFPLSHLQPFLPFLIGGPVLLPAVVSQATNMEDLPLLNVTSDQCRW